LVDSIEGICKELIRSFKGRLLFRSRPFLFGS
jgi:hypothetical protein